MFRGYDELTMDTKGRISLPARYHERVLASCQGRFVMTMHLRDQCLVLYPLPEWDKIESQFDKLPISDPVYERLKRRIVGRATEVQIDGAGRFLVSPELRRDAGLDKAVVMTGQGKKCEIWNKEAWIQLDKQPLELVFEKEKHAPVVDALGL
jgi:MraZ protein